MHKVGAHRVPPAHVAPFRAERVGLIEEMIFALVVNKAVWIVGPVPRRSEVILQPERAVDLVRGGAADAPNNSAAINAREKNRNIRSIRSCYVLLERRPRASVSVQAGVAPGRLATSAPTRLAKTATSLSGLPWSRPCSSAAEKVARAHGIGNIDREAPAAGRIRHCATGSSRFRRA